MNNNLWQGDWRWRWAWALLQAALFTLPWIGMGLMTMVTGRDLGAGLQPAWLLLALAALLLAPEMLAFLGAGLRHWLPVVAPMLLALVLSVGGIWVAPAAEPLADVLLRYLKQMIQLGVMVAFVVVPVFFMARGRNLAQLAAPVVYGALFQGLYSLAQGVHFYDPLALVAGLEHIFTTNPSILAGSEQLYLGDVLRDIPRLRGTACEPLYLGNFLLLAIPLVGVTTWSVPRRSLTALALGLLLVLTWSRGAWLAGFGAGMGFLLLAAALGVALPWRYLRRGALGLLVAVVVVIVAGSLAGRTEIWLPWQRLQQSFSTVDWSNLTRLYSMQAAWRAFLLSPVIGIGWGQFGYHFAVLVDPMGLQSMFSWPVVNNFPLAILCETGAVGLGGFGWIVFRLTKQLAWRLGGARAQRLPLLLVATGIGGVWLQLLTFSQYNLPHIWFALGLLVGILRQPSIGSKPEMEPKP